MQTAILPALKKIGTRLLFLEMVKAADQEILNRFQKDGDCHKLRQYFVNNGWDKTTDAPNEKTAWVDQLVETCAMARRLGIKLIGIDIGHTGDSRLETANPAWRDTILSTLAHHPKGTRYAVFGGRGHSANYPFNQGVNRLLGIPSVDFYDNQPATTNGAKSRFDSGDGRESDFIYRLP
jgi:hypothetical protein